MNIQRTVYEKINSINPKVELSQIEVELALVDDVQTLYNTANKLYQSNTDLLKKYASQLETAFQKTADEYKKASDKFILLEKMAKDLGIQLPNEVVKLKSLIEFGLNDSLQSKKNAVNILSI